MDSKTKLVTRMIDLKSSKSGNKLPMDWSKCLICQIDTEDHLKCPAYSNRTDLGSGAAYATFEHDIMGYDEINQLPPGMDLSRFNDGSGIKCTLMSIEAKWHERCRSKYSSTILNRLQKKIKREDESSDEVGSSHLSKRMRSSLDTSHVLKKYKCFFCDETVGENERLVNASTFDLDSRLRECAGILCDDLLLAKLSRGDVIALEAKYHKRCLTTLYSRVRAHRRKELRMDRDNGTEKIIESLVFAELVSFVKLSKTDEVSPVLKMSELKNLYIERLQDLGVSIDDVHSTRLKERLCNNIPGLSSYKQGRECILAFEDGIGQALIDLCKINNDDNAICLARAADIIREQLFLNDDSPSTGSQNVVPQSLVMLVRMILEGSSIKDQLDISKNNFSQSIAELIKFNSVKHKRTAEKSRHNHTAPSHHVSSQLPSTIDTLFFYMTAQVTSIRYMVSVKDHEVLRITKCSVKDHGGSRGVHCI